MIKCKNPNCDEKDLHPITARSYEGCCSQLCGELLDHEKTLAELAKSNQENAKLKKQVERLRELEDVVEYVGLHAESPEELGRMLSAELDLMKNGRKTKAEGEKA